MAVVLTQMMVKKVNLPTMTAMAVVLTQMMVMASDGSYLDPDDGHHTNLPTMTPIAVILTQMTVITSTYR